MNKPPRKVKIAGKNWALKIVSPDHDRLNVDDTACFGTCAVHDSSMHVSSAIDEQQAADTIWHEIMHAIDLTLGTGLTEAQVHAVAAVQLGVLRDNPRLAEIIVGK